MRPLFLCLPKSRRKLLSGKQSFPPSPQQAFPKPLPAARGALLFRTLFPSPPPGNTIPMQFSGTALSAGPNRMKRAFPAFSPSLNRHTVREEPAPPCTSAHFTAVFRKPNRNNYSQLAGFKQFYPCQPFLSGSVSRETYPAGSLLFHVKHSLLFAMPAFM